MPLNWLSKTTYAVVETRRRITPDAVALSCPKRTSCARSATRRCSSSPPDGHPFVGSGRASRIPCCHLGGQFPCVDRGVARDEPDRCSDGRRQHSAHASRGPRAPARHDATHLLAGDRCAPARPILLSEGGGPRYIGSLDGSVGLPDVRDGSSAWSGAPIDGDRIGLMQFTSGSTGLPKGVQLREGAVARSERPVRHAGSSPRPTGSSASFRSLTTPAPPTPRWPPSQPGGRDPPDRRVVGRTGDGAGQPAGATVLPSLDTIITDVLASSVRPTVCVSSSAALTRRLLSASSAS